MSDEVRSLPLPLRVTLGRSIQYSKRRLEKTPPKDRVRDYSKRGNETDRALVFTSSRPTEAMLEDAKRRLLAERSITATQFGDPAPGMSALDQRNSRQNGKGEIASQIAIHTEE